MKHQRDAGKSQLRIAILQEQVHPLLRLHRRFRHGALACWPRRLAAPAAHPSGCVKTVLKIKAATSQPLASQAWKASELL
jgi:hypothetical protein